MLTTRTRPPAATGDRPALPGLARGAALTAALVLVSLFHVAFVKDSFFTQDDYLNFRLAEDSSLSREYLTIPVFQHFLPGARLASWLLQHVAPLNWGVALGALLVALAASAALLHHVLTLLVGPVWWRLPLAVAFALSLAHTRNLMWWSGALVGVPATLAGLAALAAWLHWRRSGRWWWLGLALLSIMAGLTFIIKLLLLPLVLLGLRLFVLDTHKSPADALRTVWSERGQWTLLCAPPLVVLGLAMSEGYYRSDAPVAPDQIAQFLGLAWVAGFVPSYLGLHVPEGSLGARDLLVMAAGQAVVVAAVWATVTHDRRAWRAWAGFAASFLVLMLLVGVARVGTFGLGVAHDLRYFPEVFYLFPVFLALTLRPQTDCLSREATPRLPRANRIPRRPALLVSLALAVHVALLTYTAPLLTKGWPGYPSGDYVRAALQDIDQLRAGPGVPPLLDAAAPAYVAGDWLSPYNRLSSVLTLADPGLRFDVADEPLAVVRDDGALARAVVTPQADLLLDGELQPVSSAGIGPAVPQAWPGCVTAEAGPVLLEFRPSMPVAGRRLALQTTHRVEPPSVIPVFYDSGGGYPAVHTRELSRSGSFLQDLGTSTVHAVRLDVPVGATLCLQEVQLNDVTAGEPLTRGRDDGAARAR